MDSLLIRSLGSAVVLPLSFLLSTIFNVRRTENSSYALWTTLLLRLCDIRLDVFIICPQYGLYVSPKQNFRPNESTSSTRTQSDSKAKGVFVDNCLILPEIHLTRPPSEKSLSLLEYFGSFFKTRYSSFSEVDIRTVNATVPIIVEQKRPPSRHPDNIRAHCLDILLLLQRATSQALSQAECLFSMPKFGCQKQVMLIGASGSWWQFCLLEREKSSPEFDFAYYTQEFLEETDEEGADEDGSPDNGLDVITSPDKAAAARKEYDEAERAAMEAAKEREGRRARRDRIKEGHQSYSDPTEVLKNLIQATGPGPYTLDDLDKCSKLMSAVTKKKPVAFVHKFDDDLRANDPRLAHWTLPMQLGTPISDKYMAFIKKVLSDLAKKEMLRRKK
ncbi:hypothetical protein CCMSSC00406_0009604 [Pleurotus cornucopiae]|uniref:Uncharacterized protein n=1 Tax=Pleurotus cornucopiae TaxID=5321 RepID=A0ACB7INS1_PLECO|nr:hypothetical protein CCMSSC00406_0009604 [Pleurotus cornucopiae]